MKTEKQIIANKNSGTQDNKNPTPKQTAKSADVDENVTREEEYSEVNKKMEKKDSKR